jgi:carboxypeptidase Q
VISENNALHPIGALPCLPILCVTLGAWAAPVYGQEVIDTGVVNRIRHEASINSDVLATAFTLTDVHGPRLTGSPGFQRAGEWAMQRLRHYQLANVRHELIPWGRGWSTQAFSIELVEPQYAYLIGTPVPWSLPTPRSITADVVLQPLPRWSGRSDSTSEAFFTSLKGRLRGKVLLADAPEPLRDLEVITPASQTDSAWARRLERGDARAATEPAPRPSWLYLADEREKLAWHGRLNRFLRDEGVAAVLYQSWFGRGGTVFDGFDGARTQPAWLADPSAELPPSSLILAPEHYHRLARLVQRAQPVRLRLTLQSQIHVDSSAAFNIFADLPGRERSDEFVLIGAHFDSWAGGTGATDNAAGAAVVMEAMRILRALNLRPARTIRAALWGGHEGAGMGVRSYFANHLMEGLSPRALENTAERLKSVVLRDDYHRLAAYFNLDFGGGRIRGIYLMKDERLRPIFSSWLAPFADMGAAHVSYQAPGGSEHATFREYGLPGFAFIQEGHQWVHHSSMDVFDQLSEEHLKQSATILAAFAYFAATRTEPLPRPVFERP